MVEWNEILNNGQLIDWGYWKDLNNLTPVQAAKLTHMIDPILWPNDRYAAGKPYNNRYKGEKIDNDLSLKIQRLEQQLKNHSSKWNLVDLVDFLGDENAPFGMLQAVKELVETETEELASEADTLSNECKSTTAIELSNVNHSSKSQKTIILESISNDELFGANDIVGQDEYVTRKQIGLIFDKLNNEQWRGHFSREKANGLLTAKRGEARKPRYLLEEVKKWLKKNGHYTGAEIQLAIKKYNELPQEVVQVSKPRHEKPSFGEEIKTFDKLK